MMMAWGDGMLFGRFVGVRVRDWTSRSVVGG